MPIEIVWTLTAGILGPQTGSVLVSCFIRLKITCDLAHKIMLILQSPFNVNYGFDRWMCMFVKSATLLECSQ